MPVELQARAYRWYHKISAILFILFCLEIGVFLVLFPWTEYWDHNFFSAWIHNMYVRGAVSGVGVINLYISIAEILRLRRFSRSQPQP